MDNRYYKVATLIIAVSGACWLTCSAEAAGQTKPVNSRLNTASTSVPTPVTAELIVEYTSIQPPNPSTPTSQTRVGVYFSIEQGWHIYAKDSGDAGLPTKLAWSGPADVVFGPLHWPKPESFLDPGNIRTFGYTGAVLLSSSITLATYKTPDRSIPIHAKVEWLACKNICVPGSADLHVDLPLSPQPQVRSAHAGLFDQVE